MFTMLRRLQLQGAQAPFLNYVVCLAVLKGIKACAAQWLGQVGAGADMWVLCVLYMAPIQYMHLLLRSS
jgi:hypothetical protein